MRRFLRKSTIQREPLALTMIGLRMGERALQIGISDVKLTTELAARPGLSGHAALLAADAQSGERARSAAEASGILLDVHVGPLAPLPFAGDSFDVVILHQAAEVLAPLAPSARTAVAAECRRVLRPGGRVIAVEAGSRTGLAALFRRSPPVADEGATAKALEAGGFRNVRLLADREGYRFLEGLKA